MEDDDVTRGPDHEEPGAAGVTLLRLQSANRDRAARVHHEALAVDAQLAREAHAGRLHARRGDLELTANDNVSLDGERLLLNSPKAAVPTPALVLEELRALEPK